MRHLLILCVVLLVLAACGTQAAPTENPADVVVKYLQAKAAGNRNDVQALLCSSMENSLDSEVMSFSGLGAQLKDVSCSAGSADTVACKGSIVANYGGEQRSIPLTTYRVVREAGKLKWCGEAR